MAHTGHARLSLAVAAILSSQIVAIAHIGVEDMPRDPRPGCLSSHPNRREMPAGGPWPRKCAWRPSHSTGHVASSTVTQHAQIDDPAAGEICVTSDGPVEFTFSNVKMTLGGVTQDATIQPVTLNANDCYDVPIYISGEPNSGNVAVSITGTYTWSTTETDGTVHSGSGTLTGSSPDSPPCTDCDPRYATTTTTTESTEPATVASQDNVSETAVQEPAVEADVQPAVATDVQEPVADLTVEEPVVETEVIEEATN